jgi:hypothetical protein
MVGDIFLVTFFMWIVAVCAFAPLGYFIYLGGQYQPYYA